MADVLVNPDLLTRLRSLMRDSADKTFTQAEKLDALTQAVDDDPYVFKAVRDTSTTTVSGQNAYDLADNVEQLFELYIDTHSDGFPYRIDQAGYNVIDGQIILNRSHSAMPAGVPLVQVGKQKLYSTDPIPSYLSGYILHMAAAYLLELLIADKTGRFLKNDTSLAEIMTAINNHRNVAARYQRTLPRHDSVVF